MIGVDLGLSQDGLTLWIIANEREDFATFQRLVSQLANGTQDVLDVDEHPESFTLLPTIENVLLVAAPPSELDRVDILNNEARRRILWRLSRSRWNDVLQKISAMQNQPGHQYFDYPNITFVVSVEEGLRRVL